MESNFHFYHLHILKSGRRWRRSDHLCTKDVKDGIGKRLRVSKKKGYFNKGINKNVQFYQKTKYSS